MKKNKIITQGTIIDSLVALGFMQFLMVICYLFGLITVDIQRFLYACAFVALCLYLAEYHGLRDRND